MSVQKFYQIKCDGCGRVGELANENAEARKADHSHGIRRVRVGEYITAGRTPAPSSMYRRDHTIAVSRDLCPGCRAERFGLVQAKVDADQARYGYERVQAAQ